MHTSSYQKKTIPGHLSVVMIHILAGALPAARRKA